MTVMQPIYASQVSVLGCSTTHLPQDYYCGPCMLHRQWDTHCPHAGGGAPYPDKAKDAAHHLRNVFHRMGFADQEIVALSGAHTLGRAYPNRSGFGKVSRMGHSPPLLSRHTTTVGISFMCRLCLTTCLAAWGLCW